MCQTRTYSAKTMGEGYGEEVGALSTTSPFSMKMSNPRMTGDGGDRHHGPGV